MSAPYSGGSTRHMHILHVPQARCCDACGAQARAVPRALQKQRMARYSSLHGIQAVKYHRELKAQEMRKLAAAYCRQILGLNDLDDYRDEV